jgi:septum formation protein
VLRQAGIAFERLTSDVDEEALQASLPTSEPADIALALARAKAEAVANALAQTRAAAVTSGIPSSEGRTLVLGCDSILELDGEPYGKPLTAAEATRRWRAQRGRTASLLTGHWLVGLGAEGAVGRCIAAEVTFVDATDAEIADYVASGEPLGVAGAFTLEGRAGPLIERINGDPSNVLGLSLPGLRAMLHEVGLTLADVTG